MNEQAFKRHLRTLSVSKHTIYQFLSDVKMFFKYYNAVSTDNIQKYIDKQILLDRSSKTAYGKALAMKHYAKFIGTSIGELRTPPQKRRVEKINVLSQKEICILNDWMKGIDASLGIDIMTMKIVMLLLNMGLRRNEILSLDIDDFDFGNSRICVLGKGGDKVFVPMYSQDKSFADYINLRSGFNIQSKGLFIRKYSGKWNRLKEREFYDIVYGVTEQVFGKRVNPHAFRHTFATILLDNDTDIRIIQEGLRHKSISSTQIYTHVSTNKLKSQVETKHPMFQ